MDMGSDGISAMHAAQYKWGLAIECFPDPSHGANRDVDGAIRSAGLFPLVLLLLISFNLPFGPFKEDMRHRQLVEHLSNCFKRNTAKNCALFEGMASKLMKAYEALGEQFGEDRSKEEQLWEWMAQKSIFQRQGRRMTLCRFQAVVKGMKERLPMWHFDLFARTYVALEEDFLKGRGLQQKIQAKAAGQREQVTEGGNSTSTNVLGFEARPQHRIPMGLARPVP